jgi:hypothetical protein
MSTSGCAGFFFTSILLTLAEAKTATLATPQPKIVALIATVQTRFIHVQNHRMVL